MRTDRIDGISAYCDRWCERCAFTMRCSSYAVHVATAMCDGDFSEALALAVGPPQSPDGQDEPEPEWRRELLEYQPTEAELEEVGAILKAQKERVAQTPLTTVASGVTDLAVAWLEAHRDQLHRHGTPEAVEALQIVSWDVYFIDGKINRALRGRDDAVHGGTCGDDDPVQNDWNGSAKVALISIGRSAAAWEIIAAVTGDAEAGQLAEEMRSLGRQVQQAFPDAWKFVRPGFDAEPRRKKR